MNRSQSWEALEGELRRWRGVRATRVPGSRHPRLYLEVAGRRRYITYSTTRTDYRGVRNAVTLLRKTLLQLGAERE